MERVLKKITPKYYWLISFAIGSLAMYMMLSYSQMLSTGKYAIIGGDAMEIYVPNIRMLLSSLRSGESIWYSFSTSMGYNTALSAAYELFSPLNILFLLFPKADVNIILAIIIILKVGLSSMTFQLFMSRALKVTGISSVIFSIYYGMCGYVVVYCITNFMWLDGIYMLPILAWAIHHAVYKRKYLFLCLAYSYIFIVQFYMGYVLGIFSIMYFFLLLFLGSEKQTFKEYAFSCLSYFLSVFISMAISAIVWMPVVFFLLCHYASDSTGFVGTGTNILEIMNGFFWGEFYDYFSFPYVFCGVISIILSIVFFISKKNTYKDKIIYGVILLFFVVGCFWLPIYKMLHGFDAPDMWNWRFSFVISFLICVLACIQMQDIKNCRKITVIVCISLTVYYILNQLLYFLGFGYDSRNNVRDLLINAVIIGLWLILLFLRGKKNKGTIVVSMLLIATIEVVTNGCVRTFDKTWKKGLTRESYFHYWEDDLNELLQQVNTVNNNNDFYRICVFNDIIHNSDSYFGYNGITDFNTAENEELRNTLGKLGLYTSPRLTTATGITPSLEMLLGIKYIMRVYPDTKLAGIDAEPIISENELCLPIGYIVDPAVLEKTEWKRNVFDNQNELIKRMTGIEDIFIPISDENIKMDANGLAFAEAFPARLLRTEYGSGDAVFIINDAPYSTYMQFELELDDGDDSGIEMVQPYNMGNKLDKHIYNEFAIKMFPSGNNRYYYGILTDDTYNSTMLVKKINFYSLDEEKLQSAYNVLNEGGLKVEKYKNGYVKGTVSVAGKNNVLFTTVPYTDGWEVYVNGEKAEIVPLLDDSFIGINLHGSGEYTIEMIYRCPGFRIGLIVSIIGILALVLGYLPICLTGLNRKRRKND